MADEPTAAPTLDERQAIFRAVLESQDAGLSVPESRESVARHYSVTVEQVKRIEQEGLDEQWPPL